jgi:hypothetical protein
VKSSLKHKAIFPLLQQNFAVFTKYSHIFYNAFAQRTV